MTAITLTEDQENAINSFVEFLADPLETVFVIQGYSGTGKTTLINTLIDRLDGIFKTIRLINPKFPHYTLELTATTNKAAENFSHITGMTVNTIHSFLGLRVQTNYQTGETSLLPGRSSLKEGYLLFIDEASYVDHGLLQWIFSKTRDCKIVFIGDPAQLTPVKSTGTPVFDTPFKKACLSKVVRQAEDNPIVSLSTKFRETVSNGEFFSFKPDGHYIQYMEREQFNEALLEEFSRSDWKYNDSKLLAWTNKRVIEYNHFVRDHVQGNPDFKPGDYAVCNKYISVDRKSIKTDQLVCITSISEDSTDCGIPGNFVVVDYGLKAFLPKSLEDKKARLKQARLENDDYVIHRIETNWIDLRAAYACTINKSQGSTYNKVFIDLDDIKRCNNGNQIARMLYVAVSRARHHVIFTGDLV